jgi:hypothetical protein
VGLIGLLGLIGLIGLIYLRGLLIGASQLTTHVMHPIMGIQLNPIMMHPIDCDMWYVVWDRERVRGVWKGIRQSDSQRGMGCGMQ